MQILEHYFIILFVYQKNKLKIKFFTIFTIYFFYKNIKYNIYSKANLYIFKMPYIARLNIKKAQKEKLAKGGMITLKAEQLHNPTDLIVVDDDNAKILYDAHINHKPCKLCMRSEEINENISGGFLPQLALMMAPALAPAVGQLASSLVGNIFK